MSNWVRLPGTNPRWFHLEKAICLEITWLGDLYGPRTYHVQADYAENRRVTLYWADSLDEAVSWIERILEK
jgi:hypothetical protein